MIFNTGVRVFILVLIIFFIIFAMLCYRWANIYSQKERLIIAFMVPFLYISLILPIGIIILRLISFIWENFPNF